MSKLYYTPEPTSWYDFDQLFFGLDDKTISKISHQPKDFIKSCKVMERVTDQCRVLIEKGGNQRYLGSTFGLCYTYNINSKEVKMVFEHDERTYQANGTDMKIEKATRSGEHAGLELILDIEGDFSMRNTLTQWSGASLTLFPHDKTPDIYGKAIYVYPGTWTKIALTKEENIKKFYKSEYKTRCESTWKKKFPFAFQPYTPYLCSEEQTQIAVMMNCGCMISNKMLNGLVEMNPQLSSMGAWCSPNHDQCIDSVMEGLNNGTIKPFMPCMPLCESTTFKVSIYFQLSLYLKFTVCNV